MSDWLNAGKNKDKDNKEGTTVTKNSKEGEQDRGGDVDAEHLSLHGYIRSTPSDTKGTRNTS